jgi:hypothetical protein
MQRLAEAIERANRTAYNPVGLNVLDPRRTALLFVRRISVPRRRLSPPDWRIAGD